MIEKFFWDYFVISGNVDAYLTYKDFENEQVTGEWQEADVPVTNESMMSNDV